MDKKFISLTQGSEVTHTRIMLGSEEAVPLCSYGVLRFTAPHKGQVRVTVDADALDFVILRLATNIPDYVRYIYAPFSIMLAVYL